MLRTRAPFGYSYSMAKWSKMWPYRGSCGAAGRPCPSPDRVRAHDPVRDVDVVHVLLDDVVAGEPGEVQPVAELPLHVATMAASAAPEAALVPEHLAATTSPIAPSWMRLIVSMYAAWWRRCVPATKPSLFCLRSRSVASTDRTPAGSTATGFSAKMCLPASTAAAMCTGRKPGGVARMTRSTSAAMTF